MSEQLTPTVPTLTPAATITQEAPTSAAVLDAPTVPQSVSPESEHDSVSDEQLEELLIREITIDGMCGVY